MVLETWCWMRGCDYNHPGEGAGIGCLTDGAAPGGGA
jgi:hypothetical protein